MRLKKFGDQWFDPADILVIQHFHKEGDEFFQEHLDITLDGIGDTIKLIFMNKKNIDEILLWLDYGME